MPEFHTELKSVQPGLFELETYDKNVQKSLQTLVDNGIGSRENNVFAIPAENIEIKQYKPQTKKTRKHPVKKEVSAVISLFDIDDPSLFDAPPVSKPKKKPAKKKKKSILSFSEGLLSLFDINHPETRKSPESVPTESTANPESLSQTPSVNTEPVRKLENYRIRSASIQTLSSKECIEDNLNAIRLVLEIDQDSRFATEEEMETIASFHGWGSCAPLFDPENAEMEQKRNELVEMIGPENYALAQDSITSHYTPEFVIKAIYRFLENAGFEGGKILEPSMGSGRFFGFLPESMQESQLEGVEVDPIVCKVAKTLYPNAQIENMPFENLDKPGYYDAAIGNVPFGSYSVYDENHQDLNFAIHNYFICKSILQLRPGGLAAFVTSRFTMDSESDRQRVWLNDHAVFLGGVRLPNHAFSEAKTSVGTDILFFQRKEDDETSDYNWIQVKDWNESDVRYAASDTSKKLLNEYYMEHPEMVLGTLLYKSNQFGKQEPYVKYTGKDIEEALFNIVDSISCTYTPAMPLQDDSAKNVSFSKQADSSIDTFSFGFAQDGGLYFRDTWFMEKVNSPDYDKISRLTRLKDCLLDVLNSQLKGISNEGLKDKQEKLNRLYDDWYGIYGRINTPANKKIYEKDKNWPLLCTLEIPSKDGKTVEKADIFRSRTINFNRTPNRALNSYDALHYSLDQKGRVDFDYMRSLLPDKEPRQIEEDLKNEIYYDFTEKNPFYRWKTSAEYLSGDVKTKYEELQTFIKKQKLPKAHQAYKNLKKLKEAFPKDIPFGFIKYRLGSRWIPLEIYNDFVRDTFFQGNAENASKVKLEANNRTSDKRLHYVVTGQWRSNFIIDSKLGNHRIERNGLYLLECCLNLESAKGRKNVKDYNDHGEIIWRENPEETQICGMLQEEIKKAFVNWVNQDPHAQMVMEKIYNETFNRLVPRTYDGSYLTFPGLNKDFQPHPHQKNGIARIIQDGTTLLAWEVGAGKTFAMIAAGMERRRLGLSKKIMYVVPKPIIGQWEKDFHYLYPNSKVLVCYPKSNMTPFERRSMTARIVSGDYDAILTTFEGFAKIPLSDSSISHYAFQNSRQPSSGKKSYRQKANEHNKETKIKGNLEKTQDRKCINFESLGIDMLVVDEAHNYKNMKINTSLKNVPNLTTSATVAKVYDMHAKISFIQKNNGKVVFASATPVSNTISELYVMLLYLCPDYLIQNKITTFDEFASAFGDIHDVVEQNTTCSGYVVKTRFNEFHNMPEMNAIFRKCADVITADDLNLNLPKAEHITVELEPSESQKDFMLELLERARKIEFREVKPEEDNFLKITREGRVLSLEQRLIDNDFPDNPDSKIHKASEIIYENWKKTEKDKGVQLVFADTGIPGPSFNVYDALKDCLIDKGIPEEEIEFIHSADKGSDEAKRRKKEEICARTRKGEIRVLLGSTQKLGTGTNVQDRVYAIHHLDAPWKPSEIDQKNGRGVRQGNLYKEVKIYTYVTKSTFDSYIYQALERKQGFVSQIMTNNPSERIISNQDEVMLRYGEIKACVTNNPLMKKRETLDIEIRRLSSQKSHFLNQQREYQQKALNILPKEIEQRKKRVDSAKEIAEGLKNNLPRKTGIRFRFSDSYFTYFSVKDAGNALLEWMKQHKQDGIYENTASMNGVNLTFTYDQPKDEYHALIGTGVNRQVLLHKQAVRNMDDIADVLNHFDDILQDEMNQLEQTEKDLDNCLQEIGKPFPKEYELITAQKEFDSLNKILNIQQV